MTLAESELVLNTPDWRRVHVGDARDLETLLPTGAGVSLTITSPPYWDAVDYGEGHQIGFGQSHDDYLADMEKIFRTLYARTQDDGSLWLIADTVKSASADRGRVVPLPFELVARAESVGWILHDVIIWRKDRTLPWSHRGQLRNAFEYVLFLVKGPGFKYHLERIRQPEGLEDWWKRYPERYSPLGAAPTNVWDFPIPLQGSWSDGMLRHQCPLPRDLVRRIVDLCSDVGDVVCDPFAGVGTVPAVAAGMGRDFFGIEQSSAFVEQFYSIVLPDELRSTRGVIVSPRVDAFALLIARLRHAKLPRVLARSLRAADIDFRAVVVQADVQLPSKTGATSVGRQTLTVFADARTVDLVRRHAERSLRRPPLSKFGIEVDLRVSDLTSWPPSPRAAGWSRIPLDRGQPTTVTPELVPSTMDPLILIDLSPKELSIDC